ncbi:ubiquitin-associated domain-containing protein 1-like isoform X1 [Saccostrea echinata]|uniref:ubiquitin-associated domain-containing protein 1-like isoform X1 n=1 Tax=Saccostrea echinata TaxID=191078 RepID=UPI002A8415F1|nr:ubiquitin-associated domain-containing protein 1-like isoform X1 [Saccostrea echinata]
MYVSDSSIFPQAGLRVRITSMSGQDFLTELKADMKIDELKIISLNHFSSPADSMKKSLYHRILLVRTGKVLSEEKTVFEEGIQNNDELLLLKKRLPAMNFDTKDRTSNVSVYIFFKKNIFSLENILIPIFMFMFCMQQKDDSKKIPTEDIINKLTSTLPKSQIVKTPEQSSVTVDFQTELRKILISLIEASQKILSLNPEASKIFTQAEEMLKEPVQEQEIDATALKQLCDMGFPENRAKKALLLNDMSVMSSMEWLIQHESDVDVDEPLPGSSINKEEGAVGGKEEKTSVTKNGHQTTNILQSLREYRKREFKPNHKILQNLVEMGFDEKDAFDALRISRNNQNDACEWLLGDRKTQPQDLDEGLDTDGAVYKAIMANPQVQLGLNNPRCLLAFLQMLDSPLAAQQWLSDPDTGPLLVQVSRIYHAEKHAEL